MSSPGPPSPPIRYGQKLASPGPPTALTAGFVLANRSTPVTPTPKRNNGPGEPMRSPITMQEFSSKKPSREDSIFLEYKLLLKRATTLTTFEWDADNAKGVLLPIP